MARISRIEWARLSGRRPRAAGCNARLGAHGRAVSPPIARITLDTGESGFGWATVTEEGAEALLGKSLDNLFLAGEGPGGPPLVVRPEWRAWDFPLWDLAGRRAGLPVHRLVRPEGRPDSPTSPTRVRCYDTSLYMDDLDIPDEKAAAELIAGEALEGMAAGHRAFKIKVGRGAVHMPLEEGTSRDVAVIKAVRAAVGRDAPIMVDANNGYNLNLTCRILAETEDAGLYWMEEAFHEDAVLYRKLKGWMSSRGIETLIADGEGDVSRNIAAWAAEGAIDVVQYDLRSVGFSGWLEHGAGFDLRGVRSAPHNYGEPTTNYYACHLAPAITGFEMVEWDEATVEGLRAPGYSISSGLVTVPDAAGFGLELDDEHFRQLVRTGGFDLQLSSTQG